MPILIFYVDKKSKIHHKEFTDGNKAGRETKGKNMKASESLSNTWNIIREDELGHAIIELDGLFYTVKVDGKSYQFQSTLPGDMPSGGGCWTANWSEEGLRYVANGRSRNAAMAQWRKYIIPLTEESERLRQLAGM